MPFSFLSRAPAATRCCIHRVNKAGRCPLGRDVARGKGRPIVRRPARARVAIEPMENNKRATRKKRAQRHCARRVAADSRGSFRLTHVRPRRRRYRRPRRCERLLRNTGARGTRASDWRALAENRITRAGRVLKVALAHLSTRVTSVPVRARKRDDGPRSDPAYHRVVIPRRRPGSKGRGVTSARERAHTNRALSAILLLPAGIADASRAVIERRLSGGRAPRRPQCPARLIVQRNPLCIGPNLILCPRRRPSRLWRTRGILAPGA